MTKTNWMTKMMIASAAMVVAVGVASAQTETETRADVPFGFYASGKLLPAGSLRVDRVSTGSGVVIFRLYQETAHQSVLLTNGVPHDASKEWKQRGTPMLSFACTNDGCVLAEIWTTPGRPSYSVGGSKVANGPVRMAYIPLRTERAD